MIIFDGPHHDRHHFSIIQIFHAKLKCLDPPIWKYLYNVPLYNVTHSSMLLGRLDTHKIRRYDIFKMLI